MYEWKGAKVTERKEMIANHKSHKELISKIMSALDNSMAKGQIS